MDEMFAEMRANDPEAQEWVSNERRAALFGRGSRPVAVTDGGT